MVFTVAQSQLNVNYDPSRSNEGNDLDTLVWLMFEWYDEEVSALERGRATRPAVPHPVVFYGSSTLRLWTDLAKDLQNPRALNLAFGGSTLEACGYFFERIVPPERPEAILIYAGDNDLGDGHSPQQVLSSFRDLAAKIEHQLPGVPFTFVSIKPSVARFGIINRIRLANDMIRDEIALHASRGSLVHYISIFEVMMRGGRPRPELFLEDGLHMSPEGYRVWTGVFEKYRNTIFTPVSEPCNTETVLSGQSESRIP